MSCSWHDNHASTVRDTRIVVLTVQTVAYPCFVVNGSWFLRKAKVAGAARITPAALTVLTLLIAESDPAHKDRMTALVTTLLGQRT